MTRLPITHRDKLRSHDTGPQASGSCWILHHKTDVAPHQIQGRHKAGRRLTDISVVVLSPLVVPTVPLKDLFNVTLQLVGCMKRSSFYRALVVGGADDLVADRRIGGYNNFYEQPTPSRCDVA
jgi:hypothetical protein